MYNKLLTNVYFVVGPISRSDPLHVYAQYNMLQNYLTYVQLMLTNVELFVRWQGEFKEFDVCSFVIDDQSTSKLSGRKPKWEMRLLVQLELNMCPEK